MVTTGPYSVEDIYNVFNNNNLDIRNSVMIIESIRELDYNLEKIFGDRYSIILFIKNPDPNEEVGHFVLLSWLEDNLIEYFDSFGNEVPDIVKELGKKNNLTIRFSTRKLQDTSSYVCAKYCILRMNSLPTLLDNFIKILTSNDQLSPDEIVDSLVKSLYKKE